MPEITELHFDALLKQGERTLGAIESLGVEIRALAQGIVKGFAGQAQTPYKPNNWQLLFAVGAIIFGLMTPIYYAMQNVAKDVAKHEGLRGHPRVAEKIAAFSESLKEVETQFTAIEQRILTAHDVQDHYQQDLKAQFENLRDWRMHWVDRVARIDATQSEKIATLERRVREP